MPTHTPHSERINAAVGILKSHPTLTAAMAMKVAGFSEDDCSNPGGRHASTSIETFFPPSRISDLLGTITPVGENCLILASNNDPDAFVGIAGSMGRIERANDNAAYDELRSVDAVACDGRMRRNTPGAREERTDTCGWAARMSCTQQSTNDGSGRGWTTATLRALDVGIGDDATQHKTSRRDRNTPGAREERTGGDEEEEGREGQDGTTIDAERGTSDDDDDDKKEGATMMEGRREEEERAVVEQQ